MSSNIRLLYVTHPLSFTSECLNFQWSIENRPYFLLMISNRNNPEIMNPGHLANGNLANGHLAKGHLANICRGDI